MNLLKYTAILMMLAFATSCDSTDDMSIQEYYVTSEKNDNYLMLDIPVSIVSLSDDASNDAKKAYKSIDKVNLLAFKLDDKNTEDFLAEKQKLNKILKDPKYTELMRVNKEGVKFIAKYIGTENAMDEVLVYAYDKDKGFALARVLGDDMNPESMYSLLENIKDMDENSNSFKQMESFFGKEKY
ncbi:MAG: DUF4252 domain-containing protein [Flavobacteriaceae bacterium]